MSRFSRRRSLSVNVIVPPPQPGPVHNLAVDLLKTALYAAIILVVSSTLIARYEIEQTSMEPNFHPGQRVIVSQFEQTYESIVERSAYAAHPGSAQAVGLQRGQVVVFYEADDRTVPPLIKRLIGLPGDHVAIHDGAVFIDDRRLAEPYLDVPTTCSAYCDLTLGPGAYYFLGDNRPVSHDSRQFGPISGDHVVGRVVARFWPLDQLALMP